MVKSSAIFGGVKKKSFLETYNNIVFSNGLLEITYYFVFVNDVKGRKKKYVVEVHKYEGFAMVKYYPHHLKNNAKRFELRGIKGIGFCLSKNSILEIIYQSALLMRDYLEKNPDEFVGYVGQIDSKDNLKQREESQRCAVYNRLTSSIFDRSKYKISSKKKFKEINLRLIRLNKSNQPGKLTKKQMENYNSFLNLFKENTKIHYKLMTDVVREKVMKELVETHLYVKN